MNLRIIKKLSKRAAPYLVALGDRRQQFVVTRDGAGYHEMRVEMPRRRIRFYTGASALPGTPMIGAVSGYYEPEWDEQCAYRARQDIVFAEFTEWDEDGPTPLRRLDSVSRVFAAAALMMRQIFDYDITTHPNFQGFKSAAQSYFEARLDAERNEVPTS